MDFYELESPYMKGYVWTPYAGKADDGWREGFLPIDFLNKNLGQYNNAEDMKNATEREDLKLYFDYLIEQGKLPAT